MPRERRPRLGRYLNVKKRKKVNTSSAVKVVGKTKRIAYKNVMTKRKTRNFSVAIKEEPKQYNLDCLTQSSDRKTRNLSVADRVVENTIRIADNNLTVKHKTQSSCVGVKEEPEQKNVLDCLTDLSDRKRRNSNIVDTCPTMKRERHETWNSGVADGVIENRRSIKHFKMKRITRSSIVAKQVLLLDCLTSLLGHEAANKCKCSPILKIKRLVLSKAHIRTLKTSKSISISELSWYPKQLDARIVKLEYSKSKKTRKSIQQSANQCSKSPLSPNKLLEVVETPLRRRRVNKPESMQSGEQAKTSVTSACLSQEEAKTSDMSPLPSQEAENKKSKKRRSTKQSVNQRSKSTLSPDKLLEVVETRLRRRRVNNIEEPGSTKSQEQAQTPETSPLLSQEEAKTSVTSTCLSQEEAKTSDMSPLPSQEAENKKSKKTRTSTKQSANQGSKLNLSPDKLLEVVETPLRRRRVNNIEKPGSMQSQKQAQTSETSPLLSQEETKTSVTSTCLSQEEAKTSDMSPLPSQEAENKCSNKTRTSPRKSINEGSKSTISLDKLSEVVETPLQRRRVDNIEEPGSTQSQEQAQTSEPFSLLSQEEAKTSVTSTCLSQEEAKTSDMSPLPSKEAEIKKSKKTKTSTKQSVNQGSESNLSPDKLLEVVETRLRRRRVNNIEEPGIMQSQDKAQTSETSPLLSKKEAKTSVTSTCLSQEEAKTSDMSPLPSQEAENKKSKKTRTSTKQSVNQGSNSNLSPEMLLEVVETPLRRRRVNNIEEPGSMQSQKQEQTSETSPLLSQEEAKTSVTSTCLSREEAKTSMSQEEAENKKSNKKGTSPRKSVSEGSKSTILLDKLSEVVETPLRRRRVDNIEEPGSTLSQEQAQTSETFSLLSQEETKTSVKSTCLSQEEAKTSDMSPLPSQEAENKESKKTRTSTKQSVNQGSKSTLSPDKLLEVVETRLRRRRVNNIEEPGSMQSQEKAQTSETSPLLSQKEANTSDMSPLPFQEEAGNKKSKKTRTSPRKSVNQGSKSTISLDKLLEVVEAPRHRRRVDNIGEPGSTQSPVDDVTLQSLDCSVFSRDHSSHEAEVSGFGSSTLVLPKMSTLPSQEQAQTSETSLLPSQEVQTSETSLLPYEEQAKTSETSPCLSQEAAKISETTPCLSQEEAKTSDTSPPPSQEEAENKKSKKTRTSTRQSVNKCSKSAISLDTLLEVVKPPLQRRLVDNIEEPGSTQSPVDDVTLQSPPLFSIEVEVSGFSSSTRVPAGMSPLPSQEKAQTSETYPLLSQEVQTSETSTCLSQEEANTSDMSPLPFQEEAENKKSKKTRTSPRKSVNQGSKSTISPDKLLEVVEAPLHGRRVDNIGEPGSTQSPVEDVTLQSLDCSVLSRDHSSHEAEVSGFGSSTLVPPEMSTLPSQEQAQTSETSLLPSQEVQTSETSLLPYEEQAKTSETSPCLSQEAAKISETTPCLSQEEAKTSDTSPPPSQEEAENKKSKKTRTSTRQSVNKCSKSAISLDTLLEVVKPPLQRRLVDNIEEPGSTQSPVDDVTLQSPPLFSIEVEVSGFSSSTRVPAGMSPLPSQEKAQTSETYPLLSQEVQTSETSTCLSQEETNTSVMSPLPFQEEAENKKSKKTRTSPRKSVNQGSKSTISPDKLLEVVEAPLHGRRIDNIGEPGSTQSPVDDVTLQSLDCSVLSRDHSSHEAEVSGFGSSTLVPPEMSTLPSQEQAQTSETSLLPSQEVQTSETSLLQYEEQAKTSETSPCLPQEAAKISETTPCLSQEEAKTSDTSPPPSQEEAENKKSKKTRTSTRQLVNKCSKSAISLDKLLEVVEPPLQRRLVDNIEEPRSTQSPVDDVTLQIPPLFSIEVEVSGFSSSTRVPAGMSPSPSQEEAQTSVMSPLPSQEVQTSETSLLPSQEVQTSETCFLPSQEVQSPHCSVFSSDHSYHKVEFSGFSTSTLVPAEMSPCLSQEEAQTSETSLLPSQEEAKTSETSLLLCEIQAQTSETSPCLSQEEAKTSEMSPCLLQEEAKTSETSPCLLQEEAQTSETSPILSQEEAKTSETSPFPSEEAKTSETSPLPSEEAKTSETSPLLSQEEAKTSVTSTCLPQEEAENKKSKKTRTSTKQSVNQWSKSNLSPDKLLEVVETRLRRRRVNNIEEPGSMQSQKQAQTSETSHLLSQEVAKTSVTSTCLSQEEAKTSDISPLPSQEEAENKESKKTRTSPRKSTNQGSKSTISLDKLSEVVETPQRRRRVDNIKKPGSTHSQEQAQTSETSPLLSQDAKTSEMSPCMSQDEAKISDKSPIRSQEESEKKKSKNTRTYFRKSANKGSKSTISHDKLLEVVEAPQDIHVDNIEAPGSTQSQEQAQTSETSPLLSQEEAKTSETSPCLSQEEVKTSDTSPLPSQEEAENKKKQEPGSTQSPVDDVILQSLDCSVISRDQSSREAEVSGFSLSTLVPSETSPFPSQEQAQTSEMSLLPSQELQTSEMSTLPSQEVQTSETSRLPYEEQAKTSDTFPCLSQVEAKASETSPCLSQEEVKTSDMSPLPSQEEAENKKMSKNTRTYTRQSVNQGSKSTISPVKLLEVVETPLQRRRVDNIEEPGSTQSPVDDVTLQSPDCSDEMSTLPSQEVQTSETSHLPYAEQAKTSETSLCLSQEAAETSETTPSPSQEEAENKKSKKTRTSTRQSVNQYSKSTFSLDKLLEVVETPRRRRRVDNIEEPGSTQSLVDVVILQSPHCSVFSRDDSSHEADISGFSSSTLVPSETSLLLSQEASKTSETTPCLSQEEAKTSDRSPPPSQEEAKNKKSKKTRTTTTRQSVNQGYKSTISPDKLLEVVETPQQRRLVDNIEEPGSTQSPVDVTLQSPPLFSIEVEVIGFSSSTLVPSETSPLPSQEVQTSETSPLLSQEKERTISPDAFLEVEPESARSPVEDFTLQSPHCSVFLRDHNYHKTEVNGFSSSPLVPSEMSPLPSQEAKTTSPCLLQVEAKTSETSPSLLQEEAQTSETSPILSQEEIQTSEMSLLLCEKQAQTSETSTSLSQEEAKTSETSPLPSEEAAKTSETSPSLLQEEAQTSETSPILSQEEIQTSEMSLLLCEKQAKPSVTSTCLSQEEAKTSEMSPCLSQEEAKTSETSPLPSEEVHVSVQRYLSHTIQSTPNIDSRAKQVGMDPSEATPSHVASHSDPQFPSCDSVKSQGNRTTSSKDIPDSEPAELGLIKDIPDCVTNTVLSGPPLSVPRTEDSKEGCEPRVSSADLGPDSPIHLEISQGSKSTISPVKLLEVVETPLQRRRVDNIEEPGSTQSPVDDVTLQSPDCSVFSRDHSSHEAEVSGFSSSTLIPSEVSPLLAQEQAQTSETSPQLSQEEVQTSDLLPSQEEAKISETSLLPCEEQAQTSETSPSLSQGETKTSETYPCLSQEEAKTSETSPLPFQEEAKTSETSPCLSQEEAKTSESSLCLSQEEAKTSETSPCLSQEEAKTSVMSPLPSQEVQTSETSPCMSQEEAQTSETSPLPSEEVQISGQRYLSHAIQSTPNIDSGAKQVGMDPPEATPSHVASHSDPQFPMLGLDLPISQHPVPNPKPSTSSSSPCDSVKSQGNRTTSSTDIPDCEPAELGLIKDIPDCVTNTVLSCPPLSVPRTEDSKEGWAPGVSSADLGPDSPIHLEMQEGSDGKEKHGERQCVVDRHFVCPLALRRIMGGPAQSLAAEGEAPGDEGIGASEELCQQSLSVVYSTIEENFAVGTLQFLSDLLQPGVYPPRDITSHLLRGILLDPRQPHHLCVQAYSLLMRTQRHHMANTTTVPWDWELLTSVMMTNQNDDKSQRCVVVRMFLEYVLQTLEDDFQAKISRSGLNQSIVKATLSCDFKFSHVRDVIKWLFAAVEKSTIDGDSRDEHIRMVCIFQKMLALALEVDRSPTLCSAKVAQELFQDLISIVPFREHRMLLLESLQSKLLRCKLLERLLDYSCRVKTRLPMSLSLLLHFMKNCTLPAMAGEERWQKWDELVQLIWMLLLSYNQVMKGNLRCPIVERRGNNVCTPFQGSHDGVSRTAVEEAVVAFLSRSQADIGQALPLNTEEFLYYLQDYLLDICQC